MKLILIILCVSAIIDLFQELDENGDGYIDRDEMMVFFERLGNKVTPDFIDGIMRTVDDNGMYTIFEFCATDK